MEKYFDELNGSDDYENRLFYLGSVSDEYLTKLYCKSAALIAASIGEGFGLPIIEAARNNLPIIARDIPVFREVAQEHVYYFVANTSEELADSISEWHVLFTEGKHPVPDDMPWLTWQECTENIKQVIFGGTWGLQYV